MRIEMQLKSILLRKIFSALISAVLFAFILSLTSLPQSIDSTVENTFSLAWVVVFFIYSIPIYLVYGVSVSFFVEFITIKIDNGAQRIFSWFSLHAGFGVIFIFFSVFFMGLIALYGILAALLFAIVDFFLSNFYKYKSFSASTSVIDE